MRWFAIILSLIFLFSACAIAPYSREKNCSERGLGELNINKSDTKDLSEEGVKIKESLRKFNLEHAKDLQSCYQAYLDSSTSNRNEYSVCAITTVKDGELTFLDIADRENDLDEDLKKCLENKFHSFDYKFMKNKKSIIVEQPYHLKTRRR